MSKRKIIPLLIVFLIILLVAHFSYKLYQTYKDNQNTIEEINKIKESIIINDINIEPSTSINKTEEKKEEQEEPKLILDFSKLKSINKDTVAWIRIDNTNIDYPVVQGKDNQYYLKHSFYNSYNINGWIHEDYQNSSDFSDKNTVIFGHNTNSHTMFSDLKDIYEGRLGNNIDVTIFLENKILTYKVFSIYLENPNNTNNISKYLNEDMIKEMKKKSKLNINYDIDYDKQILTLYTCHNTTSKRIIMHAIKTN